MGKKRITITLDQEILKRIDSFVDKEKIRNRSHAIEFLISQTLKPKINQAVILAAGKGVRWRPLTNEIPKALLLIGGKPILEETILNLKKFGFKKIYLVIGHLGEKIKEYFGNGERFGVSLFYVEDKKQTGTAQALKSVESLIAKETFLVWYVDEIAELDLLDMFEFHKNNRALLTLALTTVSQPEEWGIVKLEGSKIEEFVEKPGKKISSFLVHAGIFFAEPEIFRFITKETKSLEKEVFPQLVQEGKIFGYLFSGKWFDIGIPKNYFRALKEFSKE